MDLDAFIASHMGQWRRLEDLVGRRRLSGAEADELLDLYQRVSTHLSVVRSASPDPSLVSYLSALLARARHTATGTRPTTWRTFTRFFTETFPAALYRTRAWWIATTVLSVLAALAVGAWSVRNPEVFAQQMTPAEIDAYVGTDFENYYSEFPGAEFAAQVWTNNAWIAAQCIALGVLGLPVLWVLAQNVIAVGMAGGLMASHGRASLFFGLILPHGLLELTAVFIAAAVGLRLFWSWIEPGPRTRLQSLAAEGRTGAAIALGLVVVLFVAGMIEGFVTGTDLPTWVRVGIGAVVEAAFLAYVFVVGGRAARRGVTGDVAESDREASAPVAA